MARTKTTKTTRTNERPLTRYAGVVPDTTILAAVPGWIGLGARVRLLPADLRATALALPRRHKDRDRTGRPSDSLNRAPRRGRAALDASCEAHETALP